MANLTKSARGLLAWLAQEDVSQYGECHGKDLDALVSKGLAEVLGEESEFNNPFIAKGRGVIFRAVKLTDAGHDEMNRLKTD